MRALSYFFDEALASLRRGYRTGAIAVATIAAAMFVLGGFLILTSNLDRLFAAWQNSAELSVYLRDEATTEQRSRVESEVRQSPIVAGVEVVSKEAALRRFARDFPDLASATRDLPENPLPASIEARLRPLAASGDVDALAGRVSRLQGVADVRYDRRWLQRLMTLSGAVRSGGWALAVILMIAAALTVASVVRLTLLERREEIQIMQLVGAPLAYIRGPFVIEGLLEGGVGAISALGLLWVGLAVVRNRPAGRLSELFDPAAVAFLPLWMCAALLAGGMAVGCLGGLLAARSAREVAD